MKKGTFILISCLAITLFTLSYCNDSKKPLFYSEDGNYFVDNNFIVKTAVPLAADDVKQLMALDADTSILKLTQGTRFLINIAQVQHIVQTAQILHLADFTRMTRWDRIQRILDINRGCFEVQQIDWTQMADLKAKLDGILNKYKPALMNGNVSITNNQIATAAVELKADHISQFDKLSVLGADEINICADLMGPNRFTRILRVARSVTPNEGLTNSLNKILNTYK
jgi:hypothetical protein